METPGPIAWRGRLFRATRAGPFRTALFVGLPALVALLLAYSLGFDLPRARESAREQWQRQLSAMADDRRTAIDRWITEQFGDAATIAGFPTTARVLDEPGDAHQREHARLFLTQTARAQDFRAIWIVDASGRVNAASDAAGEPDEALRLVAAKTISSGRNSCELTRRAPLSPTAVFAVPVSDAAAGGVKGAILIETDAARNLYPLLGVQPLSTRSGETLLVRRDGSSVVFLSPLRRRPDPPLTLKLPLSAGLAAGDALLVRVAFGERVDYAGVPVFAATRGLAGAAWGLVVKIDRAEALAPALAGVRRRAAVAGAVLVALAGLFFGVWRTQAASFQTSLARSLQESEARFRVLVENSLDAMTLLDAKGTILFVTRATSAILGMHPNFLGSSVLDYVHPEDREGVEARLAETLAHPGRVVPHLARCRHANGSWRDIEGTVVNRLEDPSLRALVLTFRDVTDRKRAEERLVTLSRAVEQSPVSILITDPEGRIEYVNPRFTAVSGYSLEEVRGSNPRILKSGETPPEVYTELWKTITAGREWQGELHNKRKNGELYWEDVLISPVLDPEGRVGHFLAIKEDVTRRKELESQLLHAQKMEAVGRLAGGIAHDFNNILTVITGYTAMLIEETPAESPQREPLGEVHRMAERAATLTQQLLAFSRRQVLRPRPIALNAVIAEMNRMLQRILGEDITLSVVAPSDLGTVVADPGQVEQVLVNLAVNARDAMPGGGRLRIETCNVVLEDEETARRLGLAHGRFVALTVSDTGDGIPADARDKIFEPFFTTKAQGKGTGLGLATVYGIVKQSGGGIEVESEPGRGAKFRILLPRVDAKVVAADAIRVSMGGGHESILLVEDEDAVRSVVRQILERAGYTIAEASTGEQALGLLEAGVMPDLLLTDLTMPGMDGRTLAARARSIRPALRVLVATGYATSQMEGEQWWIHKPFNPAELLTKIRQVFETSLPA